MRNLCKYRELTSQVFWPLVPKYLLAKNAVRITLKAQCDWLKYLSEA